MEHQELVVLMVHLVRLEPAVLMVHLELVVLMVQVVRQA